MSKEFFTPLMSSIFRIPSVSFMLRKYNYNFSYCKVCKVPWNCCVSKPVYMTDTSATFCTCRHCWEKTSLKDLKQIYTNNYWIHSELRGYSLQHCLEQVEKEFNKTYNDPHIKLKRRKNTINKILKHG